ncbi:MAG: hypothetical protein H7839_09015 [Magnetococcus sp. YQC-5]
MPITKNPLIGVGEVFIGPDFNTLTSIGNNSKLVVTLSENVISEPNHLTGIGTMDEFREIEKAEISIEPSDLKPSNLALGLFGTASSTAAGTVTNEAGSAIRGGTVSTAKSIKTLTTITHAQFSSGGWVSGASVSATTPTYKKVVAGSNTWIVKCTQTGVTGGTEPTWPSDPSVLSIGLVIDDNTAKWTVMAMATLTDGIDYSQDTASGSIRFAPFARITNGEGVLITYDYAEFATIEALTTSGAEVVVKFVGKNRVRAGKAVTAWFRRVRFGPASELSLIDKSAFAKMPLTGTLLADTTQPDGVSQFFTMQMEA